MATDAATPVIQDFDDPDYDPFSEDETNFGTIVEPYAIMKELREQGRVIEGNWFQRAGLVNESMLGDRQNFMVVGSKEIEFVYDHPEIFSNKCGEENMGLSFGRTITAMDGAEHMRYRRIFQRVFLPQYVREWAGSIVDPVVHRVMAPFLSQGRADLISQFTVRYPFEVIYSQLALPKEDILTFQRLAIGQTDFVNVDKAIEAGQKLGVYLKGMVDLRREKPGDDLISRLSQVEVDGERLPEDVLISFLRQLMNAGGDTTYRATSVLLTQLLLDPEQLEALRANRDLIPDAIEETLRFDTPVSVNFRLVVQDVELGGVHIPEGSLVDVFNGAINRDPAIWENPDKFDILRKTPARGAHYGFGRGPHLCVGMHLARVEMTRALTAILDRMRNLRLDPDMPPPVIRGAVMRVPKHLHVTFDPVGD